VGRHCTKFWDDPVSLRKRTGEGLPKKERNWDRSGGEAVSPAWGILKPGKGLKETPLYSDDEAQVWNPEGTGAFPSGKADSGSAWSGTKTVPHDP